MELRFVRKEDIKNLCDLFEDLGYPANEKTLEKRLAFVFDDDRYNMLVVEHEGVLVGMCGFCVEHVFEMDGDITRILSFATSRKHRRQGIGTMLMNAVHAWSIENQSVAMTLSSGIREERLVAHTFYEMYGFKKTQYSFTYKF